jgi:hypothetical protein
MPPNRHYECLRHLGREERDERDPARPCYALPLGRIVDTRDALLVWLMLVPILLRLTGRADWWLRRWLHRLVTVRFGTDGTA